MIAHRFLGAVAMLSLSAAGRLRHHASAASRPERTARRDTRRDRRAWCQVVSSADLSPRGDEAVFDKLALSAFAGTPLETALRDLGIRAFAIAGVALEIGIAPTVWHAVDLGLIPVVVADACGGRDRPAMQRVVDSIRFGGDALVTDIVTIAPLLAGPADR